MTKKLKTFLVAVRRPDAPVFTMVDVKKVRAKSLRDVKKRFINRCIISVREKFNHKAKLRRIT